MTRKILWLALGGLFLGAGCADPELEQRIAELEKQVAELNTKGPARGALGAPVNEADEQAATNLLKEASEAFEGMQYDNARAKLTELKSKYGTTRAARAAQRIEAELEIIGKPAGDLKVEKWFQGNVADLNSSKATLVVFWEVWCPHCKREVPKLTETYEKYKGQGLEMVGLTKMTRDITEQQVTEFIQNEKVGYPIAKEQGDEMSRHFGVRGIPAAAVVKDGKVVWRGHPARLTDDMIQSWLGS